MRTKRFLYNSASFAMLQILTIAGGLVLTRMYLTTYGSEINGLVSSVVQFVSYFSYVEAGLGTALIYALYKPLADHDKTQVDGIVTLAKKSYTKASAIYLALVVVLSMVYPFIVKNETTDSRTIFLLVLVIGIFGALEFYTMAKYRVLIIADQREYVISMVLLLAYVVNFLITAYMISIRAYIVLVRTVPLVSFGLRVLLLSRYVKRRYPYITYKEPAEEKYLKRRWDALIMKLSVSINTSAPIVIISVFSSLKMASVYAIYNMVFSGLIALTSIFTAGVSALFGNIVANNETEKLKEVQDQFEFFIFAVTAVLYACALIMIDPFIRVYTRGVTDVVYDNALYGYLFVIWGVLFNVRIPYTALINSSGLYRETRNVNVVQVLLLVVSGVIAIQVLDMTGVLLAMILAVFYWVTGLIMAVKKAMPTVDPWTTGRRTFRMFGIVFFAYLPCRMCIDMNINSYNGWIRWAALAFIWSLLVGIVFNWIFDRKAFKATLKRLRSVLPGSH
ncbi:hypothetical protein J0B03_05900 [Alkalibacter rhizosphaerae]|uniref:Polysaccharide biosynthesis protein n=1 Tax=Alkalibacter rhizosphaerae TaxID=2815577 RepID=A0A975AIE2_9FIRM|nr:hypothetical protein [Alkalibacter rhizosphaerae]QSX09589.1 hypothetical protein J0B03_05900 [Alkalibacter rhizosphaerae]